MAIKSINELTAMTTADLTANDVLVVGTSSGAKKIPAQDAFSGGGSSTPDLIITCNSSDEPNVGTEEYSNWNFAFSGTIPEFITKATSGTAMITGRCQWASGMGSMLTALTYKTTIVIAQATLAQLGITSKTDGVMTEFDFGAKNFAGWVSYTNNNDEIVSTYVS